VYALDRTGRVFTLAAPFDQATLVTSLASTGVPVSPVAMALDPRSGELLVLDRGSATGSGVPAVLTVRTDPVLVTRTALTTVKEPLCLMVDADGALLVGDGREQSPATSAQWPGNIVRVDRSRTPWTESTLLGTDNPLVAPTGIARTRDGRLYVLDAGLKPFAPSPAFPFVSAVAEPAQVFLVEPGDGPGAVRSATPVTEPGQLVYPTGLAASGGRLVVCDPGQPHNGWSLGEADLKRSRAEPFQFDVVVHFVAHRLPTDDAARRTVVRRVVSNVRALAERERPAHVRCNVISS
jgi:hypothetical protein